MLGNLSRMNGMSGWMMGAYYVLVSGIISSQCITSLYPQNNPCEVDAIMISKLQTAARILQRFSNLPRTDSKNDSLRVIDHKSNNEKFNIFFERVYMHN